MKVAVRVVSVMLTCEACGMSAHVEFHADRWERHLHPLGTFWTAHMLPRLTHVELETDGRPAVWRAVA